MHKRKQTLVLAATFAFALAAAPALYASDSHDAPGATGRHGMMGGSKMMGVSRMMDGCASMMQGGHGGRPNDQWRKNAPAQPDRDG